MGHSFTLLRRRPDQSWHQELSDREAEVEATDSDQETPTGRAWAENVAAVLLALDSRLERTGETTFVELTRNDLGIEIWLYDDAISVRLPYWHTGQAAREAITTAWRYLETLSRETGMEVYDRQLDRGLDLRHDLETVMTDYDAATTRVAVLSGRDRSGVTIPDYALLEGRTVLDIEGEPYGDPDDAAEVILIVYGGEDGMDDLFSDSRAGLAALDRHFAGGHHPTQEYAEDHVAGALIPQLGAYLGRVLVNERSDQGARWAVRKPLMRSRVAVGNVECNPFLAAYQAIVDGQSLVRRHDDLTRALSTK